MGAAFSIIIPVYNVVGELDRAVRSVQTQGVMDLQIVLVDDGSTDGSAELCDRLAAEDLRITVIHQPNGGVVAARQHGFRVSTGQWILFLDGDDEQMPGLLLRIEQIIALDNPDMIRFGFRQGRRGGPFEDHYPRTIEGCHRVDMLIAQSRKTPLEITEMCLWDKVYRRDICAKAFNDVGDLRIKHSEDGLFAFAALLHAKSFFSLHEKGVRYCLREGSAVQKFNCELAQEKRLFLNRICVLFRQSPYYDARLSKAMRSYHAYESLAFIFYRMLQWKGSVHQVLVLLRATRSCKFEQDALDELCNCRRQGMAFLMRHSIAYLVYRQLSIMKRAL